MLMGREREHSAAGCTMSIRRETAIVRTNLMPVGAPVHAPASQSISDRLGIKQSTTPAQWPAPFKPEFKEVPVVSSTVVNDLFEELDVDVDATGLFGISKSKSGAPKKGGMLANLKAAKSKADAVVRKAAKSASAGAKKAAAGAKKAAAGAKKAAGAVAARFAGMHQFDYQIYNDEFTAVLAVAKKTNGGTEVDEKNNIKAFKKYKHKAATKLAEAQEALMMRKETQVKKVKGRDDEVSSQSSNGRNAAVLGYSKVESDDDKNTKSNERFEGEIFDKDAPGDNGVPTIVQLDPKYDTNKVEGMYPISALVLEAFNSKDIETSGEEDGKPAITVTMQAINEADIEEAINRYTVDQVNFSYSLCVHGLYVDDKKKFRMGRKILVPQKNPGDIAAYGIATENGIESALYHAMQGTEIDLLYLWACYRLVAGVHTLGEANLDKAQKEAIKELLGEGLGMATQSSFAEDFDDDEFDEVNNVSITMDG